MFGLAIVATQAINWPLVICIGGVAVLKEIERQNKN